MIKIKGIYLVYFFAIILLICAFLGGFFLLTNRGGEQLVRWALQSQLSPRTISVVQTQGNLLHGLTLNQAVLNDIKHLSLPNTMQIDSATLKWEGAHLRNFTIEIRGTTINIAPSDSVRILPPGSQVRVQKVNVDSRNSPPDVSIWNARLKLPHSALIILSGHYLQQKADFNIFSKGLNLSEIALLIPGHTSNFIKGSTGDVDLYVRGDLKDFTLTGNLSISEFVYKEFSLLKTPLNIQLKVQSTNGVSKVSGSVIAASGTLVTPKTKLILASSSVSFNGDPLDPILDLHANARVERTRIKIDVSGRRSTPQISLTSKPSRPKEVLMLMLATGQSWQYSARAVEKGEISMDVARDFVNYLFFNGQGKTFAEKLGLDDITFKAEKDTAGVGVAKQINDRIRMDYGVARTSPGPGQIRSTEHKLGGEFQLDDHFALEASQSVSQSQDSSVDQGQSEPVGDIRLKYEVTW
jgi:hypothetical protein